MFGHLSLKKHWVELFELIYLRCFCKSSVVTPPQQVACCTLVFTPSGVWCFKPKHTTINDKTGEISINQSSFCWTKLMFFRLSGFHNLNLNSSFLHSAWKESARQQRQKKQKKKISGEDNHIFHILVSQLRSLCNAPDILHVLLKIRI